MTIVWTDWIAFHGKRTSNMDDKDDKSIRTFFGWQKFQDFQRSSQGH